MVAGTPKAGVRRALVLYVMAAAGRVDTKLKPPALPLRPSLRHLVIMNKLHEATADSLTIRGRRISSFCGSIGSVRWSRSPSPKSDGAAPLRHQQSRSRGARLAELIEYNISIILMIETADERLA